MTAVGRNYPRNGCLKTDDAAEAGPEGDGVMTWMRTVMAGPRWRSKRAHGRIWGREAFA